MYFQIKVVSYNNSQTFFVSGKTLQFPPPEKSVVSKPKPKKVMIAIQYINPCDTDNTQGKRECETLRMLKKAFLRNHYHEIDRNWEEIDLTFKFFISDREYRTWMKVGQDRIFRDCRSLRYDSHFVGYQFSINLNSNPAWIIINLSEFNIRNHYYKIKLYTK